MAQSAEQAYTCNVHQDEKCYQKNKYVYIDKCTHTHTVQTDGSEGQCGLNEIF